MIVMKFGGTSVESAEAIHRVAGIVRSQSARKPVVVVSAMGKTTNKLLVIAADAVAGELKPALEKLNELRELHVRDAVSPVVLGQRKDVALLGTVTLETMGLVLHPFERQLRPMRLLLAAVR